MENQMQKFTVDIAVVSPILDVKLGLSEAVVYKKVEIEGYSLEDAKKRNDIE